MVPRPSIVSGMPRLRPPVPTAAFTDLAGAQGGVVSRRQVMDLGMTDEQIRRALKGGGWRQTGFPGVYLAFTGPIPHLSRCWAALLYAGAGAALGMETAAWVWGLRDEPPDDVHVMIESGRRIRSQPGLHVHLLLHLARRCHPSRLPPVVRLEETVIDLIARPGSTEEFVIDVVLRACQRRLTRVDRLRAAANHRAKLRHRRLLSDVLEDVTDGVQSALERRYLRDVERAHGLPRAERNKAEPDRREGRAGRSVYRDVRYSPYRLVVELDGQAAHPQDQRERDDLRDNALVVGDGTQTLRYGWRSVTTRACETAGQVSQVLIGSGWDGRPRRCGPGCRLPIS